MEILALHIVLDTVDVPALHAVSIVNRNITFADSDNLNMRNTFKI